MREPRDVVGAVVYLLLLGFVVAFWGGVAYFVAPLFSSSSGRPACTAGASSIDAAGHTFTTWRPAGCEHR